MIIPEGKTKVILTGNVHQSDFKLNDSGYIDGYVQAADNRGYAIVVRLSDGIIDMVPTHLIKAAIVKPKKTTRNKSGIDPIEIVDLFNNVFRYEKVSFKRAPTIKLLNRIRNVTDNHFQSIPDWTAFFESLKLSPFLMGNIPPSGGFKQFRLKIDWVINEENMAKIIDKDFHQND